MIQAKKLFGKPLTRSLSNYVSRSFSILNKFPKPTENRVKNLFALNSKEYFFSTSSATSEGSYETTLKSFLDKESVTLKDTARILLTLDENRDKMRVDDPYYRLLILKINTSLVNGESGKDIEFIAERALQLGIKDNLFWFSLHNTLNSGQIEFSILQLVNIFATLLQNRAYNYFENEFQKIAAGFKNVVKNHIKAMDHKQVINAMYLFVYADVDFPELKQKFLDILNTPKDKLDKMLSSNQLATTALLASHLLPKSDAQRRRYLSTLSDLMLNRPDLEDHVSNLQKVDLEEGITEISEGVLWQSLAYLASVYSDPSCYSRSVLKKLEEETLKKYDKGHKIDFVSASMFLSATSKAKDGLSDTVLSRILEMIHTQMQNDGASQIAQFDGLSIVNFLKAINILYSSKPQNQTITEIFDYLSSLIISQKISSRFKKDDYNNLKRIFADSKVFQASDELLEFLKKASDRPELQKQEKDEFHLA